MNLGLLIYLISVLSGLKILFIVLGSVSAITIIVAICMFLESKDDSDGEKQARKIMKIAMTLTVIFVFFSIGTPSSKVLSAMYLLPKLASNEKVKQIPSKGLDILNLKLDEWISDLTGKEVPKEK